MAYQELTLPDSDLSVLYRPPEGSSYLLVLAHGAGANLGSNHMTAIADNLAVHGIGTLRYNFPYMQAGKRRVDRKEVCLETVEKALNYAESLSPDSSHVLAGHSFGGRMSSHYMAERNDGRCKALVYFSFPLHSPRKPDVKRAAHLGEIKVPMLFLSGDRDDLADSKLLGEVMADLSDATVHWLETANHSFTILKRTRQNPLDVYEEAAGVVVDWLGKTA